MYSQTVQRDQDLFFSYRGFRGRSSKWERLSQSSLVYPVLIYLGSTVYIILIIIHVNMNTKFLLLFLAGSGIFSGKAGALISLMTGVPTTKLLVAKVPKVPGQVNTNITFITISYSCEKYTSERLWHIKYQARHFNGQYKIISNIWFLQVTLTEK